MSKKIRVCCFADCCTSREFKHALKLTYDMYDDPHDYIEFVDEHEPYTHVFLMNHVMPNIPSNIPRENVIGMSYEPNALSHRLMHPRVLEFIKDRVSRYFIPQEHPQLTLPQFSVHHTFLATNCMYADNNMHTPKTKFMSFILSEKTWLSAHRYRHDLLDAIMKTNLPIDVYGAGGKRYQGDPRYKGPFAGDDNHTPFDSYKFHIAIENTREEYYISEKYTKPLLNGCIPVYLGCPKIEEIFGERCCIYLSGDLDRDMSMLHDIANNPSKYEIDTSHAFDQLWKGGKLYLPDFLQSLWVSV